MDMDIKCLALVLVLTIVTTVSTQRFQQQNYNNHNQQFQAPQKSFSSSSSCPEPNGRYPVGSCDGYIECTDGIPEEKLCPDGLLFNAALGPRAYPCQYPIDVDCTGRSALQPAQPTEDCPHQFGYFRLGDAHSCGQFMNCADGRGYTFDCPEGLAFNAASYRCDWPDQVPDCDAEAYLGFTCPQAARSGIFADNSELRYYRSQTDCQRYFVCVDGRPRLQNCGEDRAFNELTNTCDGAENVTGCAVRSVASLSTVGGGFQRHNRF